MIHRKQFFDMVRQQPFDGTLARLQVEGMSAIMNEWEVRKLSDRRWLAYMMATTFHETNQTMQPIHEMGSATYFKRMYDIQGKRPRTAQLYGNTTPGDGIKYCGRGFVQLTWKVNYEKAGKALGIDLVTNPHRAMELNVAVQIMFEGMIQGWFSGKKLIDYFTSVKDDGLHARRIINGLDCAREILSYHLRFVEALK